MNRSCLVIFTMFLGAWAPEAGPVAQESEWLERLDAEVAKARSEVPPLDEEGFAAAVEVLSDPETGATRYRMKGAVAAPEACRCLCEQEGG